MNQLTTSELAKQAGICDGHGYMIANELDHLEAFRSLIIEAKLKEKNNE